MKIGEQIKRNRQRLGISQDTMAQQIGVSPQAISRWENGLTAPDISLLPTLAYYFQISIDELLQYHPEQYAKTLDMMLQRYFSLLPENEAKAKEVLEDGLRRYPGNEQLELLQLYHLKGNDHLQQRLELCKKLAQSRQPTTRYEALCVLASTYHKSGETNAVREVLEQLPECDETKLSLSARFLHGQEALDAAQRQKSSSLSLLLEMLQIIADCYADRGELDNAKAMLLVAANMLEAFRGDIPYQFPKGEHPVQTFERFSEERNQIQQRLERIENALHT